MYIELASSHIDFYINVHMSTLTLYNKFAVDVRPVQMLRTSLSIKSFLQMTIYMITANVSFYVPIWISTLDDIGSCQLQIGILQHYASVFAS